VAGLFCADMEDSCGKTKNKRDAGAYVMSSEKALAFYEAVSRMDGILSKQGPEGLVSVERELGTPGVEQYFFRKFLMEARDPEKWLVPVKKVGYLSGGRNRGRVEVEGHGGGYQIPVGHALAFLEKVAEGNREERNNEVTEALVEIVEGVINYSDEEGKGVDNYRTDWYMVKIMFLLPAKTWKREYIEFIARAAESEFGRDVLDMAVSENVLPALIENEKKQLLVQTLEVMFRYKRTRKGGAGEIKPVMEKFWLKDALTKNLAGIIKVCGVDAARVAIEKIREIREANELRFSEFVVATVETSSHRIIEDAFECQIVDFVRDVLGGCDVGDVRGVVEELLEDNAEILKRIAIYAINQRYGELGYLFWGYNGNPWEDARREVYELLKAHCREFGDPQIEQIMKWVEAIKKPESKKHEAYRRKELLSALLEGGDRRIVELYELYEKIEPEEVPHAGFAVWHETGMVSNVSPVEIEKLIKWPNVKIAEYVRGYKDEGERGIERVSAEGLWSCLTQCCQEEAEKFAADMDPFWDVPAACQSAILRGFNEAWNARKEFSVDKVLEFIEQLVMDKGFWEGSYGDEELNYRNRMISEIADFIENGTRSDEHAFDRGVLRQIQTILVILSGKDKAPSLISDERLVLNSVLGSPRANVFSAMVLYALRYARVFKKNEKVRWPDGMRDDFVKRIDMNVEPKPDFLLTVMRYLPNIAYLEQEWIFEHLDSVFSLEDEERWRLVFEGYLGYSSQVYERLYKALRDKRHYAKAVGTQLSEKYVDEKLVQHIAIAFIEGWEEVKGEDSLIQLLLKKKNVENLNEIVNFLRTIKEEESRKKLEQKIKGLWEALFEVLEEEQGAREFQQVISRLGLLLEIVPEIDDEIKEWAKLAAKYAGVGWNGEMLVEALGRHVEKSPGYVGEIFVEMLNGGTYSDYKKENIVEIVRCLYDKGEDTHANRICNLYGERGLYFLRETYAEYNKAT